MPGEPLPWRERVVYWRSMGMRALCCADKHGAFVQPALYEAFGLTVVEAMSCGLPTFATNQGGPAEVLLTYYHFHYIITR